MNLKYGDKYYSGRAYTTIDYEFYEKSSNKKLDVGDKFYFGLYPLFNRYYHFLKSLKIKRIFLTKKDSYNIDFFYNNYKLNRFLYSLLGNIKCEVQKIDRNYIYFKIITNVKPEKINFYNYKFSKKDFGRYAYSIYNHRFNCVVKEYTFYNTDNIKLFRCESLNCFDFYNYRYCGKKYYTGGYSGKGMLFPSLRKAKDIQYESYDDDNDNFIVFNDNKRKNSAENFLNGYYKRHPHNKSWKETTKNKKQWEKK